MARSILSPDDWSAVAAYIREEMGRRKKNRSDLEKVWREVDRQVAMKPVARTYGRTSAADWYPELELPGQFNTLEVVAADARRLLFPRDTDWYTCTSDVSDTYRARWDKRRATSPMIGKQTGPMDLDQETADTLVRATIDHYHRYYDFSGQVDLLLAECLKYGTLCGRVRSVKWAKFGRDYRGPMTDNIMGPAVIPCSMKTTYLDDTTTQVMQEGIMTGPLTMRNYWQGLEDLKRAAKAGGKDRGWMKARIAELQPLMAPDEKQGQVELIFCEGDIIVPESRESIFLPNVWITVAVGNNGPVVVRFEENPQNFRSFFVGYYMRTDMDSPYGVSPLMKGQPVAEALTEIFCDVSATSRIRARPPVKWDKNDPSLQASGGPDIAPNAMIATDNVEGIVPLEIGDLQAAVGAYEIVKKSYEELTGVTDPRRSAEVKSHTTKGAADYQANIGLSRTEDFVAGLETGPLTSILYMEHQIIKDTLTRAQPISVDQNGIQGWINVSAADLPDDVLFVVNGSSGMMELQQRNQAAQQQHVIAVQGVEAAMKIGVPAPVLDIEAMIKDGYYRAGIQDPEKFIKPAQPQQPQPPPPDPAMVKVQQEGQLAQQAQQHDQQMAQAKAQMEQTKAEAAMALEQQKAQAAQQLETMKAQAAQDQAMLLEQMKSATAIEVARIQAGADTQQNVQQIVADVFNAAHDRVIAQNAELLPQLQQMHQQAMDAHTRAQEINAKTQEAVIKPKRRSVKMTLPSGKQASADITEHGATMTLPDGRTVQIQTTEQ